MESISGAKVTLHNPQPGTSDCIVEIHGSSEQMNAAQSLLQAFIATGGDGQRDYSHHNSHPTLGCG
ncbi:hypothetical protein ACLOJK_001329 [Asimina triloba]